MRILDLLGEKDIEREDVFQVSVGPPPFLSRLFDCFGDGGWKGCR